MSGRLFIPSMVALLLAVACMNTPRRPRTIDAAVPAQTGGTMGSTGGTRGGAPTGGATGGSGTGGKAGEGGAGEVEPDAGADASLEPDVAAEPDAAEPDAAPDPTPVAGPEAVEPLPTRDQVAYQRLERIAFFHFGPNTYTGDEVGGGDADPNVFNPTELDAHQWMDVLKSAGFKLAMLTAKHHDGFCLWPTKCSDYNVSKSPFRDGKGDVVAELAEAARAAGIEVGVYLSPWDRHGGDSSGSSDYFTKLECMLNELLTDYGEISEVWFDGNNAPQGDWDALVAFIRKLQPHAVVMMGPEIAVKGSDIRWVGNESGIAPAGTSSVMDWEGTPVWHPAECDVSIRSGWFHHADDQVKSLDDLLDIYFGSVGRNCPLLLNVPPDQRGLVADADVTRMKELGAALDGLFETNLAHEQPATADSIFKDAPGFSAAGAVDGSLSTYWAAGEGTTSGRLEVDLGASKRIGIVSLQEPIELGERATKYHVEVQMAGASTWTTVGSGTTIGTRNLLRFTPRLARKVAVVIEEARGVPAIAELAVY